MKTHPVQFNGFYTSEKELEAGPGDYGRVENESARVDVSTVSYIELVKSLDKKDLIIVDFGGGQGGHYFTLKENTDKNLKYHIVETPESFIEINSDVKYYKSIEEVKEENIDILYSNGTINLTKGISCIDHVHKFCKLKPQYIFLQRAMVSIGGSYEIFYTSSSQEYIGGGITYFSITTEENTKNICNSYGYELTYDGFPTPTKFIINNAPDDIGVVCYRNYLFKKTPWASING